MESNSNRCPYCMRQTHIFYCKSRENRSNNDSTISCGSCRRTWRTSNGRIIKEKSCLEWLFC